MKNQYQIDVEQVYRIGDIKYHVDMHDPTKT